MYECEELGKRLSKTISDTGTVLDVTEVVLEHVMRNFGASVIGRVYTASNTKRLERGAWQLQLGSLFDLVIPRSLRFDQAKKDQQAIDAMKEVIEATTKDSRINTYEKAGSLLQNIVTLLPKDQVSDAINNCNLRATFPPQ